MRFLPILFLGGCALHAQTPIGSVAPELPSDRKSVTERRYRATSDSGPALLVPNNKWESSQPGEMVPRRTSWNEAAAEAAPPFAGT